ncbi:hypothetical protein A2U01_0010809, partial [Trifolium medium]|nr:hypothetical protein [Trifolium medium]
ENPYGLCDVDSRSGGATRAFSGGTPGKGHTLRHFWGYIDPFGVGLVLPLWHRSVRILEDFGFVFVVVSRFAVAFGLSVEICNRSHGKRSHVSSMELDR